MNRSACGRGGRW